MIIFDLLSIITILVDVTEFHQNECTLSKSINF